MKRSVDLCKDIITVFPWKKRISHNYICCLTSMKIHGFLVKITERNLSKWNQLAVHYRWLQ